MRLLEYMTESGKGLLKHFESLVVLGLLSLTLEYMQVKPGCFEA